MAAIAAQPYSFSMTRARTALVIIDMQRDFLEAGGFGAMLGNDVAAAPRAHAVRGAAACRA